MKATSAWQEMATELLKIERLVLLMYFVALLGLLLFPIAGPGFSFLGIESDKWMHVALFGGLAVLFRWNLAEHRHPLFASLGAGFVVAAITEVAQGLVSYRSAELLDLLAGVIGTVLGAIVAHQILISSLLQRLVGLLVVLLGLMVGTFFFLADLIGVGDTSQFGLIQVIGIALSALIAIAGAKVYSTGLRNSR